MKQTTTYTLLICPQVDYFSGGGGQLPDAEEALPHLQKLVEKAGDRILLILENYPADHPRFAANHPWRHPGQVITTSEGYEQHLVITQLVAGTFGALVHPALNIHPETPRILLGIHHDGEAYSAFRDAPSGRDTGLSAFLQQRGVDHLRIAGMKRSTLIEHTAKAAAKMGLTVEIIEPACAG